MGKGKIFSEYEIVLKEKKEQVENKNIAVLFTILFIVWLFIQHAEILVLQLGIEPIPLAVEAWSLNHWATREVSICCLLLGITCSLLFSH